MAAQARGCRRLAPAPASAGRVGRPSFTRWTGEEEEEGEEEERDDGDAGCCCCCWDDESEQL